MKLQSPKGDHSKEPVPFKRKIKAAGTKPVASRELPVHPFAKAGGNDGYGRM